jgi:tight adherence protein B
LAAAVRPVPSAPVARVPAAAVTVAAGDAGRRRPLAAVPDAMRRRPVLAVAAASVAAGVTGGVAAGPVAAGLAAVYGGGATALLVRRDRAARQGRAIASTLDTVAEMAAELRAGAAPALVMEAAEPALAGTPAERASVHAACEVSERTGAPLAEVLDRVEAYLRQAHRLRLAVAAHRAGTRATALLLAVLPAGGVAVGYGVGADPLRTLLHTRAGAACAGLACALQVAGLLWTERLSKVDI